ncbi:hypothetical protein V9T40_013174 [Parthenolecanium corni]|uniref:Uncharacterized protein n=1 Tax=Parthenolecanium corni TaxID=536013 RepID=A0AAN9Y5U6_9HEMI
MVRSEKPSQLRFSHLAPVPSFAPTRPPTAYRGRSDTRRPRLCEPPPHRAGPARPGPTHSTSQLSAADRCSPDEYGDATPVVRSPLSAPRSRSTVERHR